jgi:hypothetical protein
LQIPLHVKILSEMMEVFQDIIKFQKNQISQAM